ncbi:MAG TPA: ClpXP protease specificity-enhancing factor SspB [Thermoanaerobaculia bacterium]
MDPDKIDYPAILQNALRDAVRRVLEQVAEHGLPGEHLLYIGFRTNFPGVQVPRFLRDQYPEEVTIVLQHQFWGLEVTPEDFSVLLSFGGARQQVVVPFAALTAFADPSADFGLRFDATPPEAAAPEPQPAAAPEPEKPVQGEPLPGGVIRFDPSRRR